MKAVPLAGSQFTYPVGIVTPSRRLLTAAAPSPQRDRRDDGSLGSNRFAPRGLQEAKGENASSRIPRLAR
jgi:hypothetical protein